MIVILSSNVAAVVYLAIRAFNNKDSVISKTLLVLFALNMASYVLYYLLNKYYHVVKNKKYTESLSWRCWMYMVLCLINLGIGFYFFTTNQKDKTLSPSMSRNLNQECTIWLFDNHDIWHFASAFGIFFAFMALLTMEDNNTSVEWTKIPVF